MLGATCELKGLVTWALRVHMEGHLGNGSPSAERMGGMS